MLILLFFFFFFSSRRRHTRFHVTGVQTCALPICPRFGVAGSPTVRVVDHQVTVERQIGRASCRERVKISVVAVSLKKKKNIKHAGSDSVEIRYFAWRLPGVAELTI